MATSELDTTPIEWKVVRENLVQLHCENVFWEQATDKILLDLVRYLLGDLVPHLSTLVFLRGNRCLFTIDWTKIPDSYAVWQYIVDNSFHKRTSMQVAHYHFTFMLSHVGPRYEDLVDLYYQAHLGGPHPSFRREDVWVPGLLQPTEHPEMLYLPPNLPGSTPKKANIAKPQSRDDFPSLEEMGQQELIELVKQLLEERANRPTPLANPNKDATVAGHTSMNQESLIQSSQAILQGLAEGGYIHAKTPKFECFFGDEKKNKLDFDMWERQVSSATTTHSGAAIKQAMMQSLKGQALMVTSALPPDASWEKLLEALRIKYQDRAPYDVLMAQFYGTKMDIDEKCTSFGTRLEQKLNQVSLQYPNKISETMYWNCVRERFFHGLPKDMRTNLRTQFDGGATYYQMLEMSRIVESENFHENSGKETKSTSYKGKSKVTAASVDNSTQQMHQIQQLQGAVKGLTKLLQNNPQQTQLPQISQFVPQTGQQGTQENVNTLPQATNGQGSTTPQRGRGGRGGYRGRGGRGRGGLILCYWCRDFLPKEQANHKVAQCPYQKQAKNDWWKNQLSTVQGNAQENQPITKEN